MSEGLMTNTFQPDYRHFEAVMRIAQVAHLRLVDLPVDALAGEVPVVSVEFAEGADLCPQVPGAGDTTCAS
jgi:hypothetical protein